MDFVSIMDFRKLIFKLQVNKLFIYCDVTKKYTLLMARWTIYMIPTVLSLYNSSQQLNKLAFWFWKIWKTWKALGKLPPCNILIWTPPPKWKYSFLLIYNAINLNTVTNLLSNFLGLASKRLEFRIVNITRFRLSEYEMLNF